MPIAQRPNVPRGASPYGLKPMKPAEQVNPSTSTKPIIDYKTHILVGQRQDTGEIKVVHHWDHMPTKDEIKAATTGLKYPYAQFAVCNATGFWNTAPEPPAKPLWP